MRLARSLFAALSLVLAAAACDRDPAGAGDGCHAAFANVERVLDSLATVKGVGPQLLVMEGDRVLCERTFGVWRGEDVVPIASGSKWLVSTTLLALAGEGRVSLDAPVSTYLPEFTGEKGGITVRQLLSHTSGIADTHPCLFQTHLTLAACAQQIAAAPLGHAPGTEFRYGGASFTVAGRVAEVVTGQSWAQVFASRVTGPLGMETTAYGPVPNPLLSGGAESSLRDYARMLRMIADGGVYEGRRVLDAGAVAEMLRDQVGARPMTSTPRVDADGYGLGAWVDEADGEGRAVQASGTGATGFHPWIDLQHGIVGVVWLPARAQADTYWYPFVRQVQLEVAAKADAGAFD